MVIKLIIFDLDNTLIFLANEHYIALNRAIEDVAGKEYIISYDDHIKKYNGLSTRTKLQDLVKIKNLPSFLIGPINTKKQEYTTSAIKENISPNPKLKEDLIKLKEEGYLIFCCSNAITKTIQMALQKLEIYDLFDYILGNDEIEKHLQKPHPHMYIKCLVQAGLEPRETLIVEDSRHGRESAILSGCNLCTVDDPNDTTYEHIKTSINKIEKNQRSVKYKDDKLTVLIPASGMGSRFIKDGFNLPKPLISVHNVPMIKKVVDNLNVDAEYIFIFQKSHYDQYNLDILLNLIVPGCKIITVNGITDGSARSCLLAKDFINNDRHLLIANSDQIIEGSIGDFISDCIGSGADGSILTFEKENDPKWSYVKTDDNGFAIEIKEKQPISNKATVGIYLWTRGEDFVSSAEEMIENNDRVNQEFYTAPSINYLIKKGMKIKTFNCKKMWGLGVPEDLYKYLDENKE